MYKQIKIKDIDKIELVDLLFFDKIEDNGDILVNIENKATYNVFLQALSIFLIKKKYLKSINRIRRKSNEEPLFEINKEDEIAKEILQMNYFKKVTELILKDYFRDNDVISITSFLTFNMIGFHEEIISMNENYLANLEEEKSIEAMKKVLKLKNIDFKDFSTVTIKKAGNQELNVINKKGIKYKLSTSIEQLGITLIDSNDTMAEIIFVTSLVSLLEIKKIVISKFRTSPEFFMELMLYIEDANIDVELEVSE